MTSKISLLSAALAIGTLVALPVLAETPSPAPSTVPPAATQAQGSVKTPAGQASTDVHADVKGDMHKDKLGKDVKRHEKIAEQPKASVGTSTSASTAPKNETVKQ